MDTITEADGLRDVREVPLASLGSLAGAGLLTRTDHTAPGVDVAAFNSSI